MPADFSDTTSDTTETPMISVFLSSYPSYPSYNREKSRESGIKSAINSVLAQGFSHWELLVSDNGSTDGCRALVSSLAASDSRIKLVSAAHGGVSAARNRAMAAARGQIYSYLDADSGWRPDYLQKVYQLLAGRVKVSCYAALQTHVLDERGAIVEQYIVSNDYDPTRIRRRNQIDLNTFAHSRDLYDATGGFDESLTRLVDWDLILRYTSLAPPLKIPDVCVDDYHPQGKDRVSASQGYGINRFKISLKHDLYEGFGIVLAGFDADDPLLADLARRGLQYRVLDKRKLEQGWSPASSDVVFWQWSTWDEVPGQLALAALVMDYQCAVSFYCLPTIERAEQLMTHGFDAGFHYLVVSSHSDKKALQQTIDSARQVRDVNAIDGILLRDDAAGEEYSLSHYLELLQCYYYPADKHLKIGIGIQPMNSENPLEWGDYQYAKSFTESLKRQGYGADIICRDQCFDKLKRFQVFIYIHGMHHPPMPAVAGQLRCLWIISHLDRFEPIKAAGFDYIFAASKTYVAYLKRVAPGLRVEYLPRATDMETCRPMPVDACCDVGRSRGADRGEHQRDWGLVDNRIFDVLAGGKVPISEKNDGLNDLFPFVPTFSNQSEYHRAVRSAEQLTQSMGAAAIREKVTSAHSFDHRAHLLLRRIGQLLYHSHGDKYRKFEHPRILYLCGNPSANSTRKRVLEVAEALSAGFSVRVLQYQRATIYEMLGADIIVIQRWVDPSLSRTPALFDAIAQLRPLGKQFVYEIDDLLFHMGGGLPVRLMKSCDAVITSTATLRRAALDYNSNVYLLANGVKVPATRHEPVKNRVPRILSVSTDAMGFADFRRLADHFDQAGIGCEFIYVTQADIGDHAGKVSVRAAMGVEKLHELIAEVDIVVNDGAISEELAERLALNKEGISASYFVNGKSPLKYFYAGIAAKCFVTTSEPVAYAEVVSDGVNGFFADTFEEKIRVLGELIASRSARERVGNAARSDVLARHTLIARSAEYTAVFNALNQTRLTCPQSVLVFYHGIDELDPSCFSSSTEQVLLSQISAMKNAIDGYKADARQVVDDAEARYAVERDIKYAAVKKSRGKRFFTKSVLTKWFLIKRRVYLRLVHLAKMNPALEKAAHSLWQAYQHGRRK